MKKKLKIFFLAIFIIFSSSIITYQFFPGIITESYQSFEYKKNGFSVKKVNLDGDIFEYIEGGKGKTIILLHGFHGDKRSLFGYAKNLVKDYHVIAVDTSGHGGSSPHKGQKYDLASLAKDFSRFVDELKLDHFQLLGTSMGGGIALHYTLLHPDKVVAISLLNPLGVNPPVKSEFQIDLDKGINHLLPTNMKEFDEFAVILIGQPFQLKERIKKYVLDQMIAESDFYKKAFDELVSSVPIDEELPKIDKPVLILGGKQDRVLHYASYQLFNSKLPHSELILFDEGTHVLVGKNFYKALQEISYFIKKHFGE